jgi:putative Mg2+ transporter-C (MgtC) family protein
MGGESIVGLQAKAEVRELSHDVELVVRILVGTALGGIIGYERDIHGRPAGLRTHAIVALASATFMVVSTHLAYYQGYRQGDFTEVDGSRIAASVVSGIGFLAGGTILRTGINVQGLTTAAGLWLVAAIGLCAGGGMYVESLAVTVIGVISLTLLRRFEDKDDRVRRRLMLTLTDSAVTTEELVSKLVELDLQPTVEGWNLEASTRQLTLGVRLPRAGGEGRLVAALEAEPGIARMQLEATS